MASPFFDAISAGVTGNPGTGTFTIGTVTSGFRAFSNVPNTSLVQYRAEEGSSWEIGMGLWNGTTLTRKPMYSSAASNALVSFTSAVVVSLTIPADRVMPHMGMGVWQVHTGGTSLGAAPTLTGTWSTFTATSIGANAVQSHTAWRCTSATTANALIAQSFQLSMQGHSLGGGYECVGRFGFAGLPTNPRIFWGFNQSSTSFSAMGSAEPDASGVAAAFLKKSTDTNFKFQSGTATIDTGMAPVVGAIYEAAIWNTPGTGTISYGMLAQLGSSNIWFGNDAGLTGRNNSVSSNFSLGAGLSATTGTAVQMHTYTTCFRHL